MTAIGADDTALLADCGVKMIAPDEVNLRLKFVPLVVSLKSMVTFGGVGLLDDGTRYTISQKVDALSKRIWNDRSSGNHGVTEVIIYVLYGGSSEQLPERLWQAVSDPQWKIDGLGISAFGEMVGWAMPDRFPPRNGRTSKALKSLGYDATVHVE
jgi:hypothetical protein